MGKYINYNLTQEDADTVRKRIENELKLKFVERKYKETEILYDFYYELIIEAVNSDNYAHKGTAIRLYKYKCLSHGTLSLVISTDYTYDYEDIVMNLEVYMYDELKFEKHGYISQPTKYL